MRYLMACFACVGILLIIMAGMMFGIFVLSVCWGTMKLVVTKDFRHAYSRYRHNKSFWCEAYNTAIHRSGEYFNYRADNVQSPQDRISLADAKALSAKVRTCWDPDSVSSFFTKQNDLICVLLGISIGVAWGMLCAPDQNTDTSIEHGMRTHRHPVAPSGGDYGPE